MTKDGNGNVLLPRWALWGIIGVGGLGSGGAAVTTFKVDAIARRVELHEVSASPHTGSVRVEEMARITALVEGIRGEQMIRTDRIARVEAGYDAILRTLASMEKTLDELRRPR